MFISLFGFGLSGGQSPGRLRRCAFEASTRNKWNLERLPQSPGLGRHGHSSVYVLQAAPRFSPQADAHEGAGQHGIAIDGRLYQQREA